MVAVTKNKDQAKKKLNPKEIMTESAKVPGKRGPGRPPSPKKLEKVDLATLKQSLLLDNVEALIEEKQRAEQSGVKELVIPYTPSTYQREVHELLSKNRFGVVVVHRGWGKTWLAAVELVKRAWTCSARHGGVFIYVAPEKLQAKKIVWKKLKYFVQNLPHTVNEAELTITFPNNASIELAGADNPDRLRGQHPHYVVLDEVAQMPRDTWYEAVFPSLSANKGGALFIGTPKGDNLFKELYEHASRTPSWGAYRKTVLETNVYTPDDIELKRQTLPLPKFEQEYLCSFDAAIQGTYFGPTIDDPTLGIVGDVPWDPSQPVMTAWDLGTTDATVIWFFQRDARDSKIVRIIDHYKNNEKDIFHYIQQIKAKPYVYEYHILPHDVTQVSWETGRTRQDILRQHGLTIRIAKKVGVSEGIAMAQALLYTSRFDQVKCKEGLAHLRQYRAKQDRQTGMFLEDPVHDQHSHDADAFRTLAVGLKKAHSQDAARNAYAINSYDYFTPSLSGRPNYAEADYQYDLFDPTKN